MKGFILSFIVFLTMLQVNGQEFNIDCNLDTLSARKIKIITLPTYFDCSGLAVDNPIAFISAPEELYKVLPNELTNSLKLSQYNLFICITGSSGCKEPNVACSLFNDDSKNEAFFNATVTEFGVCKILRPLIISFLVKKEDCPSLNKGCFIKKVIP